ncbi:hypothetical protein FKM82_015665 [Ascaphus truei]
MFRLQGTAHSIMLGKKKKLHFFIYDYRQVYGDNYSQCIAKKIEDRINEDRVVKISLFSIQSKVSSYAFLFVWQTNITPTLSDEKNFSSH